jgi:hypothetical protein
MIRILLIVVTYLHRKLHNALLPCSSVKFETTSAGGQFMETVAHLPKLQSLYNLWNML